MTRTRDGEIARPRANLIDRAIAVVDPVRAVHRARARVSLAVSGMFGGFGGFGSGSYEGASQRGSLSTFNPGAGGPRGDTLGSLRALRARSRDLERNNPLASGAIAGTVTSVVGPGIFPIPRLDAAILNLSPEEAAAREIEIAAEFDLLADSTSVDITGEQDFYGLEDLVLRSTLTSGDCFSIPRMIERPGAPYDLNIQLIEADRCMNPDSKPDGTVMPGGYELVAGLEKDRYGRTMAFWFSDRHPGESLYQGLRFERIEAWGNRSGMRKVLHHYRRTRIDQPRGVPFLAPVIQLFKDLGRYTEAEIVAAVLSACFAITTKTEEGDGVDLAGDDDDATPGGNDRVRFANPGMIANLMPDEQVASFMPNRPNTAFDPFVLAMLRQIGVALELPFEVLIKHFTASYSAARGALLEAYKMYRARRAWLAQSFCQPMYERALIEAAAKGRLRDMPGFFSDPARFKAWTAADWIGPSPGQIDELKEAQAAKLRVDEEFSTREEETARLTGGVWRRVHRQRAIEERVRRADRTVAPGTTEPAATGDRTEQPANPDRPEEA